MAGFDAKELAGIYMEIPKLDVAAPPCVDCAHWSPEFIFMQYENGQKQNGIILCHADTMRRDFSCFDQRMDDDDIPC